MAGKRSESSREPGLDLPRYRHGVSAIRTGLQTGCGDAMRSTSFFLLITLAVLVSPVAAQSVGASIAGVVLDESGARLPAATVTIVHATNGRSVAAKTGNEGEYRSVALQPGEYLVTAESS